MPFCPVCKNEYREGVTHCHECRVPLVDVIDDIPEEIFLGEEEICKGLTDFLISMGISTTKMEYNDARDMYSVMVENFETHDAENFMKMYFARMEMTRLAENAGIDVSEMTQEKMRELKEQELEDFRRQRLEEQADRLNNRVNYVNKHDTIEEWKSSGYVLVLIGVVGTAWMVLLFLGILPGFAGLRKNYMFMGVMSVMFVAFLIGGIVTLFKTKELKKLASVEDDMLSKIKDFCNENITKEIIEKNIKTDKSFSDTDLYYARAKYIEDTLRKEFPDMENALREKLIEEKYSEIYESDDN